MCPQRPCLTFCLLLTVDVEFCKNKHWISIELDRAHQTSLEPGLYVLEYTQGTRRRGNDRWRKLNGLCESQRTWRLCTCAFCVLSVVQQTDVPVECAARLAERQMITEKTHGPTHHIELTTKTLLRLRKCWILFTGEGGLGPHQTPWTC